MKGWEIKKLGEISDFQGGSQPPKSRFISEPREGYVRLLQIRDFKTEKFAVYVPISRTNKLCSERDIMIGRYGASVGQIHRGKSGAYNVALIRTIPNLAIVEPDYFYHYLQSALFQQPLGTVAARSAQAGFSKEDIANFPVHLPPLDEQRRIVAILDEAFAGLATMRANAQNNLKNARALFDSHLNEIFSQKGEGWVEKTLQAVSLDFGRGRSRHRPRNDPSLYGGKYPFIQTGDVRNAEHFIIESTQTYNELGLEQSKLWPKGTICITIAANIAETGILGFDACFPDSVIGIVVDPRQASNEYVEFLLQAMKLHLQAQGKGSAQDNINMATFENRMFPFPSLDRQAAIIEELNSLLENVQSLEALYRQKLAAIDELKQSILQKAFSGELTANTELAA